MVETHQRSRCNRKSWRQHSKITPRFQKERSSHMAWIRLRSAKPRDIQPHFSAQPLHLSLDVSWFPASTFPETLSSCRLVTNYLRFRVLVACNLQPLQKFYVERRSSAPHATWAFERLSEVETDFSSTNYIVACRLNIYLKTFPKHASQTLYHILNSYQVHCQKSSP